MPGANQRRGMGKGPGQVEKQGEEGGGRFSSQGSFFRAGVCLISDGFLLSLSIRSRGFQDLLRVRPSSLLMLCGCISISMASLISRSMYPVFAARSLVS